MTVSAAQKAAILEVLQKLMSATPPNSRSKRHLAGMFLDLVDRKDWAHYYEVIPEPRCLNDIRSGVEKNGYQDPLVVYKDLSLVFWNALFYNEPGSVIATDAETLKNILDTEWKSRPVLPIPRSFSPPPSSAQKIHHTGPSAAPLKQASPPPRPLPPTPARTQTPSLPVQPPATVAGPSRSPTTHVRSRSVEPTSDIEIDVDDESSETEADDDSEAMDAVRDPNSEEIVRRLENSLPKWPGFSDQGWMKDTEQNRYLDLVHAIKSHKDIIGNRLAVVLEAVSEDSASLNTPYTFPLSLRLIESKARSRNYGSSKDFDIDMARLFDRARRWHQPCTESYGHVLLLQRLYQALTAANPPVGPPFSSATNFASLAAGPGSVKPVHGQDGEGVGGITSDRVSTKDRTFVQELNYKGWNIKLADWLHLSNPDDPSRPIVAQVFRCWISDEPSRNGQAGVSVSWYFRPEQTFHSPERTFMENEVFKTNHFADHPVEDIIEKIACQFTARHIRGRPRPPFWYPGLPLYVCDFRYHDRERVFVRIKNWNSCIPEEVRKSAEFMPIYEFERMVYPQKFPSPFVKGTSGKNPLKGPGGLLDGQDYAGRKRSKKLQDGITSSKAASPAPIPPGTNPTSVPAGYQYYPSHLTQQFSTKPDRSISTAVGGLANFGNNAQVDKLPLETTKHFDRDPDTNQVLWFAAPPLNTAMPATPKHSLAYLHFLAKKRKAATRHEEAMDVDNDINLQSKRQRVAPPTASQTLKTVLD